jgi:hypothetical protein
MDFISATLCMSSLKAAFFMGLFLGELAELAGLCSRDVGCFVFGVGVEQENLVVRLDPVVYDESSASLAMASARSRSLARCLLAFAAASSA